MSDDSKIRAGMDVVNLASVPVDTCSEDPTTVAIPEGQDPQQIIDSIYRDHYEHPGLPVTKAQVNDQTGEIILIRELPDRLEYANEDVFILRGNDSRRYLEMDGAWFPTLTKNEVVALRREQLAKLLQREVARYSTSNIAWSRLTFCEEGMSHEACWEMAGNKPWADDFNEDDLPRWAQVFYKIGGAPISIIGCNSTVQLPDWYLYPDAQDGSGGEAGMDASSQPNTDITDTLPTNVGQDTNFTPDLGLIADVSQGEVTDDGLPVDSVASFDVPPDEGQDTNITPDSLVDVLQPTVGCADSMYQSIQQAINASKNGDVIEICDGTYKENLDLMGKSLTLKSQSGDAKTTIIQGDPANPVIYEIYSGTVDSAITLSLSGLTISKGAYGVFIDAGKTTSNINVKVDHCEVLENQHIGIWIIFGSGKGEVDIQNTSVAMSEKGVSVQSYDSTTSNGKYLSIENAIVENISNGVAGGGLWVFGLEKVTLDQLAVTNTTGTGIRVSGEVVEMKNVTVSESEFYGVQIGDNADQVKQATLQNIKITNCKGAGLITYSPEVTISDSEISNNQGPTSGGIAACGAGYTAFGTALDAGKNKVLITNTVIANNTNLSKSSVGGLCLQGLAGGEGTLVDSTIIGNQGEYAGGVFITTEQFHSANSNWGVGANSNLPHDVLFSGFPNVYDFGDNAIFDCDGNTGICK